MVKVLVGEGRVLVGVLVAVMVGVLVGVFVGVGVKVFVGVIVGVGEGVGVGEFVGVGVGVRVGVGVGVLVMQTQLEEAAKRFAHQAALVLCKLHPQAPGNLAWTTWERSNRNP